MKAYVATRYEDSSGAHEIGESVEFPYETAADKANFDRLVSYGIISVDAPAKPAVTDVADKPKTRKQQEG